MKVKKLKEILECVDDDLEVSVAVNTPAGFVCPGGAVISLKYACHGIDWHRHELLLFPEHTLDVHDVEVWSKRKKDED